MTENKDINERLQYFINYKKIAVSRFETLSGLKRGVLSQAFSNIGEIGIFKISKIYTTFPELNLNWLLTGQGEMTEKNKNENNYYTQDIVNSAAAESVAPYNTMNECEKEVATLKQRVKDLEKQVQLFEMLLKK